MPDFFFTNVHEIQFRLGLRQTPLTALPRHPWLMGMGLASAPQNSIPPQSFGSWYCPKPHHFWKRSGALEQHNNISVMIMMTTTMMIQYYSA